VVLLPAHTVDGDALIVPCKQDVACWALLFLNCAFTCKEEIKKKAVAINN
jgi:hypothetical protein